MWKINRMDTMSLFKDSKPFEERCIESENILKKFPDRVPVICEPLNSLAPKIKKNKFLVPSDLKVAQFMYIIRQQILVKPEEALFLHVQDKLPSAMTDFITLYRMHRDDDGFLYMKFSKENTFG
jgi:GABA(A) receptor-associated protein